MHPTPSAVKNAGTYHLATRQWTRSTPGSALGPDVLYNNTGLTGYFTTIPDTELQPYEITDSGRLPSLSSVGHADCYTINGIQFGYCSGSPTPLETRISFRENYAPCANPLPPVSGALTITGLPTTSSAGVNCWTVTIDLQGTALEFGLSADADGFFHASPALDSFGLSFAYSGHGLDTTTGPIIAGDPANAPFGAGTRPSWGFGAGPGTGLDQQDFFWIDTALLAGQGCYFFGGYPTNPWSGFYYKLMGDAGCPTVPPHNFGTRYGNLTENTVAPGAEIYCNNTFQFTDGVGMLNPPDPGVATFTLQAGPVPQQPGLFFLGSQDIVPGQPFGCGERLAGGTVVRLPIVAPPHIDGFARYEAPISVLPTAPGPVDYFFQFWYRDPDALNQLPCANVFNLSRAIATAWR